MLVERNGKIQIHSNQTFRDNFYKPTIDNKKKKHYVRRKYVELEPKVGERDGNTHQAFIILELEMAEKKCVRCTHKSPVIVREHREQTASECCERTRTIPPSHSMSHGAYEK